MKKCTYCGRESEDCKTKFVEGYEILEYCSDCEAEILKDEKIYTVSPIDQDELSADFSTYQEAQEYGDQIFGQGNYKIE